MTEITSDNFYFGVKAVCLDADDADIDGFLTEGKVYSLSRFEYDHKNPENSFVHILDENGQERAYWSRRFRLFNAALVPVPAKAIEDLSDEELANLFREEVKTYNKLISEIDRRGIEVDMESDGHGFLLIHSIKRVTEL